MILNLLIGDHIEELAKLRTKHRSYFSIESIFALAYVDNLLKVKLRQQWLQLKKREKKVIETFKIGKTQRKAFIRLSWKVSVKSKYKEFIEICLHLFVIGFYSMRGG